MPVNANQLEEVLRSKFLPVFLKVEDESGGCGQKFSVEIVSSKFEGMALLDRHRLVNETLKQQLKDIHALTMKTLTPQQYEQRKLQAQ